MIKELNLVPLYDFEKETIFPGVEIPVPCFCAKNVSCNEKCKKYYQDLRRTDEGLYKCPYGFCSYVFDAEEQKFVFSSLRIAGQYDKGKLLPKIKNDSKEYREIELPKLETYKDIFLDYRKNTTQYDEYKSFIENMLHDVRKFNQQIKLKNDRIYRKAQQHTRMGDILEAAKSIQQLGWFLTVRLNNHDFTYNGNLMKTDVKTAYNFYRITDKVRICMQERIKEKDLSVKLQSQYQCSDIKAYDCIELLPYLFLDNAIKYSPESEDIKIIFEEKNSKQLIKFSSLGPVVSEEEIEKLQNQGYRGDSARKLTKDGMGIGLYTAKCICDLNGIRISILPKREIIKRIKGIDYAFFVVELEMLLN